MTRPVYEPSTQRQIRGQGFTGDQLLRRPAPTAAATGATVEWAWFQSTTNWADTGTIVDFTIAAGDYDSGPPATFDLSSGNILFEKDGVYDLHMYVINAAADVSGAAWNHVSIEFDKVSGPSGAGPHGWTQGAAYQWLKLYFTPSEPIYGNEGDPHLHTFVSWVTGTFVGTPFELSVTAQKFWDGAGVAENDAVLRLLIVRNGDTFS